MLFDLFFEPYLFCSFIKLIISPSTRFADFNPLPIKTGVRFVDERIYKTPRRIALRMEIRLIAGK